MKLIKDFCYNHTSYTREIFYLKIIPPAPSFVFFISCDQTTYHFFPFKILIIKIKQGFFEKVRICIPDVKNLNILKGKKKCLYSWIRNDSPTI